MYLLMFTAGQPSVGTGDSDVVLGASVASDLSTVSFDALQQHFQHLAIVDQELPESHN